jgi:hypothetical protein
LKNSIRATTRAPCASSAPVAAPYSQLDVGTGEEGVPNIDNDQPTNLGVVNVYRDNMYSVSFHRNGIAYTITSGANDAATWLLPILQSWEFE